ncbi:MAG: Holliday junction resolvase RuvX [Pseudomonadota bacterium]
MTRVFQDARAFRESCPTGALLGCDVGTQTVGVAVCDPLRTIASAQKTLARGRFHRDLEVLQEVLEGREIAGAVVGLPVHLSGGGGPRVQAAKAYARNLSKALDVPVLLWDERWSTVTAERGLIDADMSRAKRAEVIDAVAAAVILQAALDRLAHLQAEMNDE